MPIYNTWETKNAPQNECQLLLTQLRALCIATLQLMLCRADCLGAGAPHLLGQPAARASLLWQSGRTKSWVENLEVWGSLPGNPGKALEFEESLSNPRCFHQIV